MHTTRELKSYTWDLNFLSFCVLKMFVFCFLTWKWFGLDKILWSCIVDIVQISSNSSESCQVKPKTSLSFISLYIDAMICLLSNSGNLFRLCLSVDHSGYFSLSRVGPCNLNAPVFSTYKLLKFYLWKYRFCSTLFLFQVHFRYQLPLIPFTFMQIL